MTLCAAPVPYPTAPTPTSDFEQGVFAVLDRLLSIEKEAVHATMAQVLTHLRDSQLSHATKLYALLLSTCFVAHMEIAMDVPHDALARLLQRGYADLQAAIATGEIPQR